MYSFVNNLTVYAIFHLTLIGFPFVIPAVHAIGNALTAGIGRLRTAAARESSAVSVPAPATSTA
jgi:hypothetical protein